MGFTEVLTIVFITLKLCGVIDWSWWAVWSPELVALAVYLVILCFMAFVGGVLAKCITSGFRR